MTNAIEIDGTDAEDLTKATLICRRQMDDIVRYLREFVPGYENCFILSSASLMGIRETRHFKGRYTLNEQDILEAKVFEDYVVKDAYFNFDIHNISGSGLDKTGVQKHFSQEKGYTIPYRCLLPEKKENLLLCGRNISGTHMAHSNFRVMPICVGIGEAAGAAARIALFKSCSLTDVIELQERLSTVRADLERIKAQKQSYDGMIAYSGISLDINEVERVVEGDDTFFGEVKEKLMNNLYELGDFFRELAINSIAALPYIAILTAVAVVVIFIVKKTRKR